MLQNLTVGGKLSIGSALLTYGGLFGKNVNVWRDMDGARADEVDRIGYALTVNANQQLELIKVFRFNDSADDSQKTVRTRRVALFDNKNSNLQTENDVSYLDFDNINGMDVVDAAGNIVKAEVLWQWIVCARKVRNV